MHYWETLRNPKSAISPSVCEEYMVVPITENATPVIGYAVVNLDDLKPDFKTLREAQRWAEQQMDK